MILVLVRLLCYLVPEYLRSRACLIQRCNVHVCLQAAGAGSKRKLASAVVVADDPDGEVHLLLIFLTRSGSRAHTGARIKQDLTTVRLDKDRSMMTSQSWAP